MTLLEKIVAAFKAKPAPQDGSPALEDTRENPALEAATENVPGLVADAVALVEAGEQKDAEIVTLKAELAKRDAEKLAADEKAKNDLEAARKEGIEAQANAFVAKCVNVGKAATDALRAEYVAALESGNTQSIARLETIGASFKAAGPIDRLSEKGPTAEEIADRVKPLTDEKIVPEAVRRIKAKGITPKHPEWSQKLGAEILLLKNGDANAPVA